MKKIFFLIIVLALGTNNAKAFKYESEEGLTWMGLFGMNISALQNHDYKAKAGAMMGARADYMLPHAHGAYLTAGLDWTMKGGKKSETVNLASGTYNGTGKYNLNYIEIPVRAGFRYNFSESIGVYGEVGPYFAIGVGGRHKLSIDGDGPDVRTAEDEGTYRAFANLNNINQKTFQLWDAGIGFRVGVEYNEHYNLMLGCDWGLTDMFRDSLRDDYWTYTETTLGAGQRLPKVHNFNFNITVGYRF